MNSEKSDSATSTLAGENEKRRQAEQGTDDYSDGFVDGYKYAIEMVVAIGGLPPKQVHQVGATKAAKDTDTG